MFKRWWILPLWAIGVVLVVVASVSAGYAANAGIITQGQVGSNYLSPSEGAVMVTTPTPSLTIDEQGNVTCYRASAKDLMRESTEVLVAYLALCKHGTVKWAKP